MHKCVAKYGTFMYYWYRVTRGWTIMTQEKTLNPSEKFFLAAWQAAAGSSNILKKLTASGHLPSELWQMPDDALSGILQEKPEHLARALAIRYGKPELPEILAARDRTKAGATAPAHGLYLKRVSYGNEKKGTKADKKPK